ncbi:MAG: hypothetical protein K0R93_3253 [Anaerosolibacter sp.]|nr:hypothetical protein [Anaerosolibacter sp.]
MNKEYCGGDEGSPRSHGKGIGAILNKYSTVADR